MSEAEAAWVRANAWTRHHRRIDGNYPHGYFRWCDCERSVCSNCVAGAHETCATRNGPKSTGLDAITGPDGYAFPGARLVLADHQRDCSWICPCDCPQPTGRPAAAADPGSATGGRPRQGTQAALFD